MANRWAAVNRSGMILVVVCAAATFAFGQTPKPLSKSEKMAERMARLDARAAARTSAAAVPSVLAATTVPNTNDLCANAFVVGIGEYAGNNSFASTDGSSTYTGGENDVWFVFTPTETTYYRIVPQSEEIYTVLSIHSACPGTDTNQIAGSYSSLFVELTSGVSYIIRLAGDNYMSGPTKGPYTLTLSYAFPLRSSVLDVAVDPNGTFTLATAGDPYDSSNRLLFGHPSPWSSETTFYVDGSVYGNGLSDDQTDYYELTQASATAGGVNTTVWSAGGIELTQRLSLSAGSEGGPLNNLRIEYTATNVDTVNHVAGIRIFLDTWLGDNDGAPFRVPGIGDVTHETERWGLEIPSTWSGFDDLDNPDKIAHGTLVCGDYPRPDRVIWGAWATMCDHAWDYAPDGGRLLTDDSAVAVYFHPTTLRPGQSRTVGTFYGTTTFEIDINPPLAIALSGPGQLDEGINNYIPNPFFVVAYIEHSVPTVTVPVQNAFAEIRLPSGFSLKSTPARSDLGTMNSGDTRTVWWYVEAEPRFVPEGETPDPATAFTFQVDVGGTSQATKTVSLDVLVPELEPVLGARTWQLYQ